MKEKLFIVGFIFFLAFLQGTKAYSQAVLKGAVRSIAERGQTIEVNLSTPVNFYFSQAGDKVAAFTKEDILIGEDFYIPKGSRIEGVITNIKNPKRFGQNGAFEINFNEIITPNNTKIPIYASVSTDTKEASEKVADILTYDSALIAYGTINGLIAGVQYGGIPLAITTHGISLLTGAGIGATLGIIGSALRKGEIPSVSNAVSVLLSLKTDFYLLGDLPTIEELKSLNKKESGYKGFRFYPKIKKEDVELAINSIKKEHSKVYGDYIILSFNLKNNSKKTISLSDLILTDNVGGEELHPDLFLSSTEILKTIKPFDEVNASLAFLITNKLDNYFLAVVDPLDREEVVRIPLKDKL